VDLGLPLAKPGARPGADVAAPIAVRAVVGGSLVEVERAVGAVLAAGVVVAEDVEGAHHHARRAPGAQAGGHDLVEELAPLRLRLSAHLVVAPGSIGVVEGQYMGE